MGVVDGCRDGARTNDTAGQAEREGSTTWEKFQPLKWKLSMEQFSEGVGGMQTCAISNILFYPKKFKQVNAGSLCFKSSNCFRPGQVTLVCTFQLFKPKTLIFDIWYATEQTWHYIKVSFWFCRTFDASRLKFSRGSLNDLKLLVISQLP